MEQTMNQTQDRDEAGPTEAFRMMRTRQFWQGKSRGMRNTHEGATKGCK